MALGCEILFSKEQGKAMRSLIERTTGEVCPCRQGKPCPLLGNGRMPGWTPAPRPA
jgi:hypothetical protein